MAAAVCHPTWTPVELTNADGTGAAAGSQYIRLGGEITLGEAIVEAGSSGKSVA